MYRTDDPAADYDRYCAEQEKELALLPECSECGEKIMDDQCWKFGDEPICDKCAENNYRIYTSDLMR